MATTDDKREAIDRIRRRVENFALWLDELENAVERGDVIREQEAAYFARMEADQVAAPRSQWWCCWPRHWRGESRSHSSLVGKT